jgi:hypothetical protein
VCVEGFKEGIKSREIRVEKQLENESYVSRLATGILNQKIRETGGKCIRPTTALKPKFSLSLLSQIWAMFF